MLQTGKQFAETGHDVNRINFSIMLCTLFAGQPVKRVILWAVSIRFIETGIA